MPGTTEEKDYFFNIIYRSTPIASLDTSIEKLAGARGGVATGSGYCLASGERDITVAFSDHMSANKFRADIFTEPELAAFAEKVEISATDIDQHSRIQKVVYEENWTLQDLSRYRGDSGENDA